MNIKQFFITAGALLSLLFSITSHGDEDRKLADEVETPDTLLRETDNKAKQAQYGDEDIKLKDSGRSDNSQITPDPLEKNLMPKEKNINNKKLKPKKEKTSTKKQPKKAKKDNDEITTPDPILDMFN